MAINSSPKNVAILVSDWVIDRVRSTEESEEDNAYEVSLIVWPRLLQWWLAQLSSAQYSCEDVTGSENLFFHSRLLLETQLLCLRAVEWPARTQVNRYTYNFVCRDIWWAVQYR